MLTWDYQLNSYKAHLSLLDQSKRLDVALAAIANIRDIAVKVLQGGPTEAMDFFNVGINLIRTAGEVSEISEQRSRSLLDGTSTWLPETGAGVRDAMMCIVTILQRAGRTLRESDVYEIMSYAYQVVLYSEILSKLEHEVTEAEVRRLESASSYCMACIAAQIQLIVNAVKGAAVQA